MLYYIQKEEQPKHDEKKGRLNMKKIMMSKARANYIAEKIAENGGSYTGKFYRYTVATSYDIDGLYVGTALWKFEKNGTRGYVCYIWREE